MRGELLRRDHEVDGKVQWKEEFFFPLWVKVFASLGLVLFFLFFFFFPFFFVTGCMAIFLNFSIGVIIYSDGDDTGQLGLGLSFGIFGADL